MQFKMWKSCLLLLIVSGSCNAGPLAFKRNMPIIQQREQEPMIIEPNGSDEVSTADMMPSTADSEIMKEVSSTLTLPSNATSIRADITDSFSCSNKTYGYYADVANDCQIFHVCLPVTTADGKEHTFRWSFICPEETVFSQENFICMRREDMTIDCEESFKYFELNRNFGVIEEESDKKNNDRNSNWHRQKPSNKNKEQPAATMPVAAAPAAPAEETMLAMAAEQSELAAVPAKPSKPAKVPKPIRRKPSIASPPLRKIAPATAAVSSQAEPEQLPAVNEESPQPKPTTTAQRFTKRPSTMSSQAMKEKVQASKPDATQIRQELYSQKRKRPSFMNQKKVAPTTTMTTTDKPAAEEEPAKESEAEKLEPVKITLPQEPEAAASEQAEVIVSKPSEQKAEATKTNEDEVKPVEEIALNAQPSPIEAFEEIPAVIVEVEEGAEKDAEPETTKNNAEEVVQEEEPEQAAQPAKESEPAVIPEVTQTLGAIQPEEDSNLVPEQLETIMEPQGPSIFETPSSEESEVPQKGQEQEQTQQQQQEEELSTSIAELEAAKPVDAIETVSATSSMEHQNPIIEETYGNADADSVPEVTDEHLQSMGGFKPVDPAMAAEAEALIADFINTLMKNEQQQKEQMAQQQQQLMEQQQKGEEQQQVEEQKQQVEESQNSVEEQQQNQEQQAERLAETQPEVAAPEASDPAPLVVETEAETLPLAIASESEAMPPIPELNETDGSTKNDEETNQTPIEAQAATPEVGKGEALKSESQEQLVKVEDAEPSSSNMFLMMQQFPNGMYQIPVKVITDPMEELQFTQQEEQAGQAKQEQQKTEEQAAIEAAPEEPAAQAPAQPAVEEPVVQQMAPIYKPFSIDDVVQLVKEQLDQVPKSAEEPVKVSIKPEETKEDATADDNSVIADKTQQEQMSDSDSDAESEAIVVPIYQRMPDAVVPQQQQQESETATINETDTQATPAETPKMERYLRGRNLKKMDPRKRRFLFKSDAS